jgi:homoserine dehydrogenase
MTELKVGICGWGNVATGLYEALHGEKIAQLADCKISVTCIGARRDNPRCDYGDTEVFRDIFDIPEQDIDVVIELIGGVEIARELILKAIAQGKHVVTANKAVIYNHGDEIFDAARAQGVQVLFEASVCAGTPIVKLMQNELGGNKISKVSGMLNGTSNFILSSMEEGMSFDEALTIAQEEGYAEPDPSFDIEGMDAAHKIGILAYLAYGSSLPPAHFYVEGITNIASTDFQYAKNHKLALKHLAVAKLVDDAVEMRVHPVLMDEKSSLASLQGVRNGIELDTNLVGKVHLAGSGAGRESTASGLISDLMSLARSNNKLPSRPDHPPVKIVEFSSSIFKYYFYLEVDDELGAAASITSCFAKYGISLESIIQEDHLQNNKAPMIITTDSTSEKNAQATLEELSNLSPVSSSKLIRIERDS